MAESLYFSLFIDCEATQPAVADAPLGERASRSFAEVLEAHGLRGTFHVLPGDIEAHSGLYRDLHDRNHELGLHVHPAADGFQELLGVYGMEDQARILRQAADRFAQVVGFLPDNICIGYVSTKDFTYQVLYDLGFRHGTTSLPTRVLPECASIHAGAPLDVLYAHRFNRVLAGDLDYVEIPPTIDPDSRMWGGRHPLDLRIELVDTKNHWYTIGIDKFLFPPSGLGISCRRAGFGLWVPSSSSSRCFGQFLFRYLGSSLIVIPSIPGAPSFS